MKKKSINIVWFKRDLRLRDHQPLAEAIKDGLPVLLCYFFEPSVIAAPENAVRHWRFIYESLEDLKRQLQPHSIQLYVFHNEVLPIFEYLNEAFFIKKIYSHQETGLKITYDRDRNVQLFCKKNKINWQEFGQDGVQRGIKNRLGWNVKVTRFLVSSLSKVQLKELNPLQLEVDLYQKLSPNPLPTVFRTPLKGFQKGGETLAWRYLHSFFEKRYPTYFKNISKPEKSRTSCSRLSPYLAFGNLSAKQVYQYSEWAIKNKPKTQPLKQFQSRVWWRSHFIQKLETEWQIEFEAINKGLDNIPRIYDVVKFDAWATGQTGFPMVDACMRCLKATGFINFRMRAMLVSFATFTLWQDWKKVATHLAGLFLDFEPGIHFAQIQMQSGLTGYNTLRIYNPTFQIEKHDTEAIFIKKWLPELANVPIPLAYEPWKMTKMEQTFYQCDIGKNYPAPIVDFKTASKESKDLYWTFKMSEAANRGLKKALFLHCMPNMRMKTDKD
jgi:deoxyribodipyrimidine photo-lyase